MFETAELGSRIPKREYREREPLLRQDLLQVQQELREFGEFPVIIVFAGVDGAGKGQTVNLLNAWLDPRWLVHGPMTNPRMRRGSGRNTGGIGATCLRRAGSGCFSAPGTRDPSSLGYMVRLTRLISTIILTK